MNTLQDTINTMVRNYGMKGVITHITRTNTYGKITEATVTSDAYMLIANIKESVLPDGVQGGDLTLLVAWSSSWGFDPSPDDRIALNGRDMRVISVSDYYASGGNKTLLLIYARA